MFSKDQTILHGGDVVKGIVYNRYADEAASLPIRFVTASTWHRQEDLIAPRGFVHFHQILLVLEGRGVVRCNGQTHTLQKGSAFLTVQHTPVEYRDKGGLVSAFLTVQGSAVKELLAFFDCDGFLYYPSVPVEKYLSDISRLIQMHEEQQRQGALSAAAYSFYVDFLEQQNEHVLPLNEVVRYIEKNFSQKLILTKLAEIGCMSVSRLCHTFKETYKTTVFQYIINLRLTYARTLLLSSARMTVREAAFSCGFEDASYFCRAYKAKFGKTPLEDRRSSF